MLRWTREFTFDIPRFWKTMILISCYLICYMDFLAGYMNSHFPSKFIFSGVVRKCESIYPAKNSSNEYVLLQRDQCRDRTIKRGVRSEKKPNKNLKGFLNFILTCVHYFNKHYLNKKTYILKNNELCI